METATSPRVRQLRDPEGHVPRRRLSAPVRRRNFLLSVANHSVAIALGVFFFAPFVFVVLTALMTGRQSLSSDLWPHPFMWSNFTRVFHYVPFLNETKNSIVYAGFATVGTVVSSVPPAYAFSRMRWNGRQAVFLLLLATLMLPSQVTIVPLFTFFARLHWVGSLKPLIVPTFFGDAFSIFLLRQFFLTIPEELLDAARVDGANELQLLWHVVVKLAKPAIMAVALFQFLYSWNDFFGPLLYTLSNQKVWTLAVGLSQITSIHSGILWNLTMAASVLFMAPVIVLFVLAQKAFIEGVTLTGVKG